MPVIARIVLEISAVLITLGGVYDLFAPRLPANLAAICEGNGSAQKLARELLRALGGALAAIGLTVFALVASADARTSSLTLALILLLVIPAEGINAFCMRRVGSPFYVPLIFVFIALFGVFLAAPSVHP
jgi:hypothetical protein